MLKSEASIVPALTFIFVYGDLNDYSGKEIIVSGDELGVSSTYIVSAILDCSILLFNSFC